MTEEELAKAWKLKGRTRRCRSDVRKGGHRDPMLREFFTILRRERPEMANEIRAWKARREPVRQPAD